MNRPKPRYEYQQHQHPQQHHRQHHNYGGNVPQGPPPNVAQNRMPNAGSTMRTQGMNARAHVPQQQQPQQQPQQMQGPQVQQQTHHGGGVPVQHQYSHVSQGHPAPQMYYLPAQPQHGGHSSYIQISPFTISTSNPGMPLHPITQLQAYAPRYTFTYQAQPGQTQGYYPSATAAAPAQAHTMYSAATAVTPQYVHQPHRMNTASLHPSNQAVANAQQLQQASVAPTHVSAISAQHQPHNSHPQQQGVQVGPPPAQPITRSEVSQERKRNRLKIIDPKTGEDVLDESTATTAGGVVSSTPNAESTSSKGSSNESAQNSLPSSSDKQDTPNQQNAQQAQASQEVKKDETATSSAKEEAGTAAVTTVDRAKSNVRAEFFQKIAQASDDARTSSSASTGSSSNANASNSASGNQTSSEPQPPEPAVASPVSAPSTPAKEKSPSPEPSKQLVPNTPVAMANTSSDDSKDASLVSISPTPIEQYSTPRRDYISSPPLTPTIEKSTEEETLEQEPSEEGTASEEITESEVPTEPISEKQTCGEELTDSVQEDIRAESELSDSAKHEDLERDEPVEVEEEETIEENQPNGHVPLEEGEIRDEEDEESTAIESGTDNQEDSTETETAKGKIKYDREFLLKMRLTPAVNEFKVADHGLPDLARDNNMSNHIKHGGIQMSKSPGPNYGRMRGMPNQGNKGNMLQQGIGPMRQLGAGGIGIGWGSMAVPPPPPRGVPPKVLMTLQREEVKLHKAENAWKPNPLKRDATAEKNADQEALMIESIVKKTRGILNKLTPDNFEKLVQTFMELPLEDKDDRISSVISVVFEKAIDEPSFSTAYARMVHTVCKTSLETSKKFRKKILDQCQKEFQRTDTDEEEVKSVEQKIAEAKDDESREQLKLELEEKKYLIRRRSLGNVRFIGELYKLQMLTPKIMVECVHMLLCNPDEEKLECLCKLLTTVGDKLDLHLRNLEEQAARGDKPKFVPEPKWMDRTFNDLSKLSEDKKFSSRIRFAILDVVELRDNGWKPRRDTNAPKTIEEVRKEAYRQEMEEKRQINSLPPVQNNYAGGGDRDHRTGNSRLPSGPPQQKKGDWTTVQNSKTSSRFQTIGKKTDTMGSGGNPVLAPPSFGPPWASKSHSGPPGSQMKSNSNIPPRFLASASRFSNLSVEEGSRAPHKIHNSDPGTRDQHPPFPQHSSTAPPLLPPTPTSPPPSTNSSATNSRPVSPKEQSEAFTADTPETVKNIFQEYLSCKKFDDTLHWIKNRFPGHKIDDFVDELCRQVGEMSKEIEQKCAGILVRALIRNNEIPKDAVIKLMAQGVMQDLPDVLIDSPMATQYLAHFLVEVFYEESNLNWLVQVGDFLIHNEDDEGSAWRELAVNTINLLKLRHNEENVQTSFKQTKKKDVIPVDEIPWLQDKTPDVLAAEMVKVLSPRIDYESTDEVGHIFQENSWDVREETVARALTEAICTLTWNPEAGNWNDVRVRQLIPLLALPNQKIFPAVWQQVEDYLKRKKIDKKQSEGLWSILFSLNMTTTGSE